MKLQTVSRLTPRILAMALWDTLLLRSNLINEPSKERRESIREAVRQGSIVAWRHINLHGEYDFSDEKLRDSIGFDLERIIEYAESA